MAPPWGWYSVIQKDLSSDGIVLKMIVTAMFPTDWPGAKVNIWGEGGDGDHDTSNL